MVKKIEIERFSLTTQKPFDDVLAAINEGIGHPNMAEFWESARRTQTLADVARDLDAKVEDLLHRAAGVHRHGE